MSIKENIKKQEKLLKDNKKGGKMATRYFDGVPFKLYRRCKRRSTAEDVADRLRANRYYVRITNPCRGLYLIWAVKKSFWDKFFG